MATDPEGLRPRVRNDGADEKAEIVVGHRATHLGRTLAIVVKELPRHLEGHEERHVRIAHPAGPDGGFWTCRARHPDRRVGLLKRQAPRVDMPAMVVLALPAERTWGGPAIDDEVMAFLQTLTAED